MDIFNFLSKFLPLLILPFGFFFFICIFWKFHKSKILFYLGGFLLFLSSLGISSQSLWLLIEHPYKRIKEIDAPESNAIVVLGGGYPERFLAGIKLYKNKKSENLIFSAGEQNFLNSQTFEGKIYKNDAINLGIPKDAILVTKSVFNTLDEAKALEEIFSKNSLKKEILLVTSAFHMKRAQRLFEREGFRVNPFPVDFNSKGKFNSSGYSDPKMWMPNAFSLSSSSIVLREYIGRLIYRIF